MSRILRSLAIASAVICASTGASYVYDMPNFGGPEGPPGVILLTLGLLGAAGLFTVGYWQSNARDDHRALPLAILAGLAGGYVFANVIGLNIPGSHSPHALSWVGLVPGIALFVTTLAEIVRTQRNSVAQSTSA